MTRFPEGCISKTSGPPGPDMPGDVASRGVVDMSVQMVVGKAGQLAHPMP